MWELSAANIREKGRVESYLREGYEPFAVVSNNYGEDIIWFRRKIKIEIHSDKSTGSKSRAGKPAIAESKEEVSP